MLDFNALLKSKTMWATLVAILATVAQMFGWDVGNTDGIVEQVIALVAGVVAMYGRITSVTRIIK